MKHIQTQILPRKKIYESATISQQIFSCSVDPKNM